MSDEIKFTGDPKTIKFFVERSNIPINEIKAYLGYDIDRWIDGSVQPTMKQIRELSDVIWYPVSALFLEPDKLSQLFDWDENHITDGYLINGDNLVHLYRCIDKALSDPKETRMMLLKAKSFLHHYVKDRV